MSSGVKFIEMTCPRCKKVESTILDEDAPQETVLIELACPPCLDGDDSLPIFPIYRDRHCASLVPLRANSSQGSPPDLLRDLLDVI